MSIYRYIVSLFIGLCAVTLVAHSNPVFHIKALQPMKNKSNAILVQQFIDTEKKEYANGLLPRIPPEAPGKNELYIDYQTVFENRAVTSIKFDISKIYRGAAHPFNEIATLNIIHGKGVSLAGILTSPKQIEKIAHYCTFTLLKEPTLEKNWLRKGAAASPKNYKNWNFNQEGLVIYFDRYQVASESKTVVIPKDIISPWMVKEVVEWVWES